MKVKVLSLLTALSLLTGILPEVGTQALAASSFIDVPSNAWYAQDIQEEKSYGIISGKGNDQFDPSGTLTTDEAITLAARTRAKNDGEVIPSISGDWAKDALNYAISKGICTNSEYKKGCTCTRRNMASLFACTLPVSGYKIINSNVDVPDIENNTESAYIYRLYGAGILTGSDIYGTFYPDHTISRAEAAVIINRVINPEKRKTYTLPVRPNIPKQSVVKSEYMQFLNNRFYLADEIEGSVYDYEEYADYGETKAYAIMDANQDGIPELLIQTAAGKNTFPEWRLMLVYTYNMKTAKPAFAGSIYAFMGAEYSFKYKAFVFTELRPQYGTPVQYTILSGTELTDLNTTISSDDILEQIPWNYI